MNLRKRVQKIEASLTPKQAVLRWVMEMLETSHETYAEKMLADPRNPRVEVLRVVGEAVRQNLSDPPLEPERLEQVVREAQKEADMLMMLALNLQDRVRRECELNRWCVELLTVKFEYMLKTFTHHDGSETKEWERWQAKLTDRVMTMRRLKKTVAFISSRYFDGHPLLFAADAERLHDDIVDLEDVVEIYSRLEHRLACWKPIDIDAQWFSNAVEAQVEERVAMAKATTLKNFGEEEAARELLDSLACHAFRELDRLRSSSSAQVNLD